MSSGRQRRRAGGLRAAVPGMLLALAVALAPAATRADMASGWQAYTAGDYESAIRIWQPLAEAGDHQAAYALGMAWQIAGRPGESVPWYEQAAQAGVTEAQVLLGTIYARGSGVPRDLVRAYAWLHKAAEAKGPNARLMLDSVAALMTAEEIAAAEALSATL